MKIYLIRTGEYCAGLILKEHLEQVAKCDDPEDPMTIVKEFGAVCWCAAQQVFAKHQGHEPYDMWDCVAQEKREADDQCRYYPQQTLYRKSQVKKKIKKLKRKRRLLKRQLKKLEAR